MIFFKIPDIRLFWSTHERFLNQFKSGEITEFKPFSELSSQRKDISFWVSEVDEDDQWLQENDFFDLARTLAGDLIESISLMDKFYHPKKKRHSRTFTLIYSPIDPDMNNSSEFTKLVNGIQEQLAEQSEALLGVELRSK